MDWSTANASYVETISLEDSTEASSYRSFYVVVPLPLVVSRTLNTGANRMEFCKKFGFFFLQIWTFFFFLCIASTFLSSCSVHAFYLHIVASSRKREVWRRLLIRG